MEAWRVFWINSVTGARDELVKLGAVRHWNVGLGEVHFARRLRKAVSRLAPQRAPVIDIALGGFGGPIEL